MKANLDAAKRELELARATIERMEASTTLAEVDHCWKEFLSRIRRVWYKTLAAFNGDPNFRNSKHFRRVDDALTNDELICYLAKARDADEHTIEEITRRTPSGWAINLSQGGSLLFHELTDDGKPSGFSPTLNPHAVFQPSRIVVSPATTRGRTYAVPKLHLGIPIGSNSMLTLARLGVEYYAQAIDSIEADE